VAPLGGAWFEGLRCMRLPNGEYRRLHTEFMSLVMQGRVSNDTPGRYGRSPVRFQDD
jgi:hypothetical protein